MMNFGNYRDTVELLDEKKSGNYCNWICTTPFTKYVLPSFLFALVILISVYFGMLAWFPQVDFQSQSTCRLQESYYVSCLAGEEITLNKCLEVGCCWREDLKICYHAFPSRYGYRMEGSTVGTNRDVIIRALTKTSPMGHPIRQKLGFRAQVDNHHIRIALKTNENIVSRMQRNSIDEKVNFNKLKDFGHLFDFLPLDDKVRIQKLSLDKESNIEVLLHKPQFAVTLSRTGNTTSKGTLLVSTARGPLIVTDDYWEWSLYMTSATLYGLNDLELNGTTNWIYNNENDTIRPAFLAIDSMGNAMTCFVNYDGPLEVKVLNQSNLVVLRGFSVPEEISIEIFSGPRAIEAVQQLSLFSPESEKLPLRSSMLGLQLCPELGGNPASAATEALKNLKDSIDNMDKMSAPWDSHCFYRRLGLALEHQFRDTQAKLALLEARQFLEKEERQLATHLTPMLYNKAESHLRVTLEEGSCLLGNRSGVYVGLYDEQGVVYPDWTENKTEELAKDALAEYVKSLQPSFIVLRDAWPKDQRENPFPDNLFDYLPEGLRLLASRGTIPFNLVDRHYSRHNSYGPSFSRFVATGASTTTTSERLALVELRGHECNSPTKEMSWLAFQRILRVGIVSGMMGQMPTAMYVCGTDDGPLDDELCLRWYGVAVTWPRIIVLPEKSPGGTRLSRTAARQAAALLKLRAQLATYQHTVLARFAKQGSPIFSATLIWFTGENQPRNTTNNQFMWGDSILVGAVILPRHTQVTMWLPGRSPWRHLKGGSPVNATANGTDQITVVDSEIALLVRPGRIVPLHKETGMSTRATMLKNLTLLANLVSTNQSVCEAKGRIYYGNEVKGVFLLVQLFKATLTLENLNKTREIACDESSSSSSSTSSQYQTTIIEDLEILGTTSQYQIDIDLCSKDLVETYTLTDVPSC